MPLTIAALAHHAHVPERTFARRFSAETGTTPLRWLLHQRVLAARELLETSTISVDEVAERCGFATAASLRATSDALSQPPRPTTCAPSQSAGSQVEASLILGGGDPEAALEVAV